MTTPRETDLYPAIKSFLEAQGYSVKGEVHDCDIMALREADEEAVIVEMKTAFTLPLIFQGLRRKSLSDIVYLAVPAKNSKTGRSTWRANYRDIIKMCRLLGLGLMAVHAARGASAARVEVHLDPAPYRPRRDKKRRGLLLREFQHRVGDPNPGGSSKRPLITAYRQDALRIAAHLGQHGPTPVAALRDATAVTRAAAILQRDVYGWFQRITRGTYDLSPTGQKALETFADAVAAVREGDLHSRAKIKRSAQ